jgi:hypothetical protein
MSAEPGRKDSPHGSGTYGVRPQRDLLGGELPTPINSAKRTTRISFFDYPPPLVLGAEPVLPPKPEIPAIRGGLEYFRGREVPTRVWAPTGIVYYRRLEDIPTKSRLQRDKPFHVDIEVEERNEPPFKGVILDVFPLEQGESEDASFKFIGEQGLYVRVVVDKENARVGEAAHAKPTVRWMHFNEEDAELEDVRYF